MANTAEVTQQAIDYTQRIPNNVDLANDRALQRALERWQPAFLSWWGETGPENTANLEVYLRTAVSVDRDGWANFGYVRMPEYRWGIFLTPRDEGRNIHFGDQRGQPAWQDVPGEYRSPLRRIIVTQGDTEPASVEQQRLLGATCPSLYDLRNLFQVNVEEGRHLWAMVYLLHRYFGRDGREEAEALLQRRSGDANNPRILTAFNEKTSHWLAYYMFTFFTDRDGKFQLAALAESAFDPLARTTRFMLTEEAHHMFIGESGVARILQRTCEAMSQNKFTDPAQVRAQGVIDFDTLQKFVNFHYSATLDLFGSEISSNAASYYTGGLKGRFSEANLKDNHSLTEDFYAVQEVAGGEIVARQVPALTALNARLRDDFTREIQAGLDRWNRIPEKFGIPIRLKLPHAGFHRKIGSFAGHYITPDGRVISKEDWERQSPAWLPTDQDHAFVNSLMGRVIEPGQFANWIAPPARGINNLPIEFEYVRFN
ncbi:MAG: benzoyl-CoA 2,3-epoxidase subunit BoxB [Bryobacterales bacterium]|nr:benzoyl-CoA 2,3-epoxidase subunit BoxB [Bryobacterales bacterium]MBV9400872.1 benzoyl-CoA 2,3-epoxidase subunit BoxB [Bryobacterales bacterium]